MARFRLFFKICLQIFFVLIVVEIYLYISRNTISEENSIVNIQSTSNHNKTTLISNIQTQPFIRTTYNTKSITSRSNFSKKISTFVKKSTICDEEHKTTLRNNLDREFNATRSADDIPNTWGSYFDMDSINQSLDIQQNIQTVNGTSCFAKGLQSKNISFHLNNASFSDPLLKLIETMRVTTEFGFNALKNRQASFTKQPKKKEIIKKDSSTTKLKDNISFKQSKEQSSTCRCNNEYRGKHCSVPRIVWQSNPKMNLNKLILRSTPRRIIQAFPLNIEYEMLEARFDEIGEEVDVFLILESNYTMYGTPKELYLLNRLRLGLVPEKIANKIVHIFLDFFPEGAKENGWITQGLHQNYIGTHGMKKIRNWKDDDLYVITDADELPKKEVLQFLKWHDHFSFPVSFFYDWSVYGFFWLPDNGKGRDHWSAVDLAIYKYVLEGNVYSIRSGYSAFEKKPCNAKIIADKGGLIAPWTIGNTALKSGWHCSWCTDLQRIRTKLVSAQNGDFPRWGDYPEKSNITYIRKIVKEGLWFDDKSKMAIATNIVPPSFFRKDNNSIKYEYILKNVYVNKTTLNKD